MKQPMHAGAQIGHVHLKVSDLARSESFYRDVLGFTTTMRGDGLVFMSFGGYHHHLALNSTMSEGREPPPEDRPGLLHFAVLYPNHGEFTAAVRRAIDRGAVFHRASDYGYSVAAYTRDPDGIEIELSRDRSREKWPRDPSGELLRTPERITVPEALERSH